MTYTTILQRALSLYKTYTQLIQRMVTPAYSPNFS